MTQDDGTQDDGGFGSVGGTSDEVRVAQLLAGLADDPAAPPSTVTASSVIAAARAAAGNAADPVAPTDSPALTEPAAPNPARSADVIEFRPRRRRFVLAGLVAAASLAGISALAISLTVTGGSSTSTSADGARAVSAESAGSLESAAAAAVQPPAALSAASAAAPEATGQAPAAAGAAQDDSAPAAAPGAADSGPAADTSTAGCWPALSAEALAALNGALPTGAFGSPQPLTADCDSAPIGGVVVPGTAPGTVLVVRVTNAVPGACLSDTSIGTACVARGEVYVASDESGSPVVFAYGNGDQVMVSGWPGAGDSVARPSGLTVEQSAGVAEAVLAALA